jgi:Protein of unknown function (DUF2911).
MSVRTAVSALLLLAGGVAGAQAPTSGMFVTTLGSDTLQIERYTRDGDRLEGDILRRSPRVQVMHYVADMSKGGFRGISLSSRRYGSDPAAPAMLSIVSIFGDTSARVDVMRSGRPDTAGSGTKPYKDRKRPVPGIPGTPASVGLYEQILTLVPPARRDSVTFALASITQPELITVARKGRDSVSFTRSFFPGWTEVATVDANGRIQSLDAGLTTVKTYARRSADVDFEAAARAWTAYETAHGPMGQVSSADTVRATIGAANIEIAYSRPSKRNRVIFGNIVPWNQVWRTGANAATQFTTSADLVIGNAVVPAGKYTLWSLPSPTGAKLIINSQTGQWGTDYDASRDLARVDLTQTMLAKPVEVFIFGIVPQGNGGALKFAWDDREYSVPFKLK